MQLGAETDDGTFWSAAQVYGGQEHRASDNLKRQGFETILPLIVEHIPGRKGEVTRPTFPGYLFIGIAADMTWGPINNTFGVLRLLTRRLAGDILVPDRIPLAIINSLKECLLNDNRDREVLEPGTTVRVIRGTMTNHQMVVRWSAGERLGLLFSMFNREQEFEFALGDVEVV